MPVRNLFAVCKRGEYRECKSLGETALMQCCPDRNPKGLLAGEPLNTVKGTGTQGAHQLSTPNALPKALAMGCTREDTLSLVAAIARRTRSTTADACHQGLCGV